MNNTKNGQILGNYWAIIGRLFPYCFKGLGNLDNYFKKNPRTRARNITKTNYIFLYLIAQIAQIAQRVEYQGLAAGQLLKRIAQIAQKFIYSTLSALFLGVK